MIYSVISLQKEVIFINQILNEIEILINSSKDYFTIKEKLNKLWSKLYLKEKRKDFREQITENYYLIERITNLEQKPFYFIDQAPAILKPNEINKNDFKN